MTNTKAILGISLTAVFAVAMMFAPNVVASSDPHFDIVDIKFETFDDFAKVTIETDGDIPVGTGAFGYGVLTAGTDNVLAFTSHVCAADSFVQGDIKAERKNCPFAPQGSIGVLEFLRDNVGAPFKQGQIDQKNDGPLMHPHVLDLTGQGAACSTALTDNGLDAGDAALEVDVGSSLGNNISPSTYTTLVDGNELTVGNIPLDDLNGDSMGAYATFNIFPLHDGQSNITNLCLYDLTVSTP